MEGDTYTYDRIETVLKRLGFVQGDVSFRWHRQTPIPLTVEFFCPAGEERPPGFAFRPNQAKSPTAKHNLGGRLSALALKSGELLTTDVQTLSRTVELPQNKGTLDMQLKVTWPLAFLVAKMDALLGRHKPKDAYDIVGLIESWPGGPASAATAFAERPTYNRPEVDTALRAMRDTFGVDLRPYDLAVAQRVHVAVFAHFIAGRHLRECDDRVGIGHEAQRPVDVDHIGFDGQTHRGELIVREELVPEVITIFEQLDRLGFPIEKIRTVDHYPAADDELSMEDNNTSAFNCTALARGAGIGNRGGQELSRRQVMKVETSRHSCGPARVVNPLHAGGPTL